MLSDEQYMSRALALAERGRGRTAPNPMVGAVVVDPDGVIVGRGAHERAGTPHAEVHALDDAGERARGATLYCTLEPCCHTGRTGPCVERIVSAGIRRVVAAVEDPNPVVHGGGFRYLRTHGIEVLCGPGARAARRLNAPFFSVVQRHRPWVTVKIALSADGRIAASPGVRTPLTGADANRLIHRTRAEIDAIGVGSGTILADDPLLTPRGAFRAHPLTRVIFDRRLRTPPAARVLSTQDRGRVIIMTTTAGLKAAPERASALIGGGAEVDASDAEDLSSAVARLHRFEIGWLLLEGGAAIHSAAFRAGIVDHVQAFITPRTLGEAAMRWVPDELFSIRSLHDTRTVAVGEDTLVEGYVHRID